MRCLPTLLQEEIGQTNKVSWFRHVQTRKRVSFDCVVSVLPLKKAKEAKEAKDSKGFSFETSQDMASPLGLQVYCEQTVPWISSLFDPASCNLFS